MEPDNMVPAVVALFLRVYGQVAWSEVHRMLNRHVLRGTWRDEMPEEQLDLRYEARKKQLENGVRAIRRQLVPVMRSLY